MTTPPDDASLDRARQIAELYAKHRDLEAQLAKTAAELNKAVNGSAKQKPRTQRAKKTSKVPTPGSFKLEASGPQRSYTDAMAVALKRLNRGVTHAELRNELQKRELAGRDFVDKSFYGAIIKLKTRGVLAKHGGLLYFKAQLDHLLSVGSVLPKAPNLREGNTAASLVLGILKMTPEGLTGQELQERLTRFPEAPGSIRKHKNYIYNVMGELLKKGLIHKVVEVGHDAKYSIGPKSEAPAATNGKGLVSHAS